MKVSTVCLSCMPMHNEPFFVDLQPQNSNVYEITCPRHHFFKATVLYHEFEKLFEVAVNALHDSYFREAIGSFAASYERFMELFIRIVAKANGVGEEELASTWKQIAKQSERQIGAFTLSFLLEFKSPPPLLAENPHINLRNKVVHQGYFPTREECIAYGDAVLAFIRNVIRRMHESEKFFDEMIRSINDRIENDDEANGVICYPYPLIGTNRPPEVDVKSLEEMVAYCAKLRSTKSSAE